MWQIQIKFFGRTDWQLQGTYTEQWQAEFYAQEYHESHSTQVKAWRVVEVTHSEDE